ncbi:transferase, partial [Streptomyces longwoodensis]
ALRRALPAPGWGSWGAPPRGPSRAHLANPAAGLAAGGGAAPGRPRAAALAGLGWVLGTAEFARARIAPGPRTRDEVATMLATSVLIPPAASWHRISGAWRHRAAPPWREVAR